jgi:transposase
MLALEACGGAHYWVREIMKLGHTVQLISPAYVKPFVKRQKNDAAVAEASCEAAQRPSMRFVTVEDEAQQARDVVFAAPDVLVRQRTQCINALRGHLTEYGWVVDQGAPRVPTLIDQFEDPNCDLPESARHLQTACAIRLDPGSRPIDQFRSDAALPPAARVQTSGTIHPCADARKD